MYADIEAELHMKVERVLGRGSFATVYYCIDSNAQPWAVKTFNKRDFTRNKLKSFRKQAEILASIEHVNVVKFKEFRETDSCLYLIMEYIGGGTLKTLMFSRNRDRQPFSDGEVAAVMRSILQGIQYLHRFNIIHRDLKPENILVADSGDCTSIKIVDFGLSAQIQAGSPYNVKSQCGTLLFMAPEILHQPSYSKAVDIWSCSIIMYMLYCNGRHPIYTQNMKSQVFKQKLKNSRFPQLCNPMADNFIKNLSKIDYTQRYSVNQALRHPWITRNQDDQIPLSVNQSILSFNTANLIADGLKFSYVFMLLYGQNVEVPQDYIKKVTAFGQNHDQNRARSPSSKKIRRKNNQVFFKLKQLMVAKQNSNQKQQKMQLDSPIIRRHQRIFMSIFDKHKSETITLGQIKQQQQCPIVYQSPTDKNSIQIDFDPVSPTDLKPSYQYQYQYNDQPISPCLVSSRMNYNQSRNYEIELPLIKVRSQKKGKGTLRKLHSMKQQKHEHHSYFKNYVNKNTEWVRDIGSSKSRRVSVKVDNGKGSPNKFNSQRQKKRGSRSKDVRPMIFGIK